MKTNAVIEALMSRRSQRAFQDRPLDREDLETLVTCAQWAPSAHNRQEWVFAVVTNRDMIQRLAAAIATVLNRDSYDMYAPQALIVVAHKKKAAFGREDDGCAMENIMVAAQSLGLGSVWINQLQGICDEAIIRPLLDAFGIPSDYEVHGVAALGYGTDGGRDQVRKSQVVWND